MTPSEAAPSTPTAAGEGSTEGARQARAYCGPAHSRTWTMAADDPVPEQVAVPTNGHTYPYRLVHDLRPIDQHATISGI